MIENALFDSSEYYDRRYNNFSTLIIFPIFCIVISTFLFSFIGEKEITVKSIGEIEPETIPSYVQSTSNKRIILNNLSENKFVHKGDLLLTYDNGENAIQLDALQRQLDATNSQLAALEKLKAGIANGGQPFPEADEFGYSSQLADYRAQVKALNNEDSEKSKTIGSENNSVFATKDALKRQIDEGKKNVDNYMQLENAIKGEGTLPDSNPFVENYKLYKSQIEADPLNEDSITGQLINEIDNSLLQLNTNIGSLQTQLASSVVKPQVDSTSSKLEQLKSQYLLNSDRERSKLISTKLEIQTKISLTQVENTKSAVKAETSGVLHVKEEVKGMNEIPEGTVIAQIYPKLTVNSKLNIRLNIPVSDISSIHEGQVAKLSNYRQHAKPLIITGTISSISTSPIRTEHGNYYEVRAKTSLEKSQLNYIRYGYQGTTVIITGSKSYFNYYKDLLLHEDS